MELYENQVMQRTKKLAAQDGNRKLTYRELDNLSNAIAIELMKYSIAPDDIVGIIAEKKLKL